MNLKKILADHKLWLESDSEKGERADMRGADMSRANLNEANLRGADLDFFCWPLVMRQQRR